MDLQVATQPPSGLQVSPAPGQKRPRPDPTDVHELARYEEEDALERRFGQVDARISHEVGKLQKDIDKIGGKMEELSGYIKSLPSTPSKPWELMGRGKKWTTPPGSCEKGAIFWVIARDGRFSPWAPYAVRVTGVAPNGAKVAFQGALLEELGGGDRGPLGPIVEGETTDLWEEVEARNSVLEVGE